MYCLYHILIYLCKEVWYFGGCKRLFNHMAPKDFLWAIMKEDCFVWPLGWVTAVGPSLGLCGEASGCCQNLTDNLIVHSFWYHMNAFADQKTWCLVSFSITSTSICIYMWLKINKKENVNLNFQGEKMLLTLYQQGIFFSKCNFVSWYCSP